MLDNEKISNFISARRRKLGMTQRDVAKRLNVSFQAVSKWENGTLPNIEILAELAKLLQVSADEILSGIERAPESFSYGRAGVDIAYTDEIKREMSKYMKPDDKRVISPHGSFASLYDITCSGIDDPVLVLKSEEPGSKQKLAMEYGYTESLCYDMVNHLVNDIAVMGARPLAVLDTIVCSNAERETIISLIKGISDACRANECSLVGGETSIQPRVVENGTYILTSSIAGLVSRGRIIDGSSICEGDAVLAVASNGLHTNGYSLIRLLIDKMPHIKYDKIDGQTFIEQIMKPHTPYYGALKHIFGCECVHGIAHITGGGIKGNLSRIIPDGLCAEIDLAKIKALPIFSYIKSTGGIDEQEMLATFNCGVGLTIVADRQYAGFITEKIGNYFECYEIGKVIKESKKVIFKNHIDW